MHTKGVGFDTFQDLNSEDPSFEKIFDDVSVGKHSDYVILNDYLF
jgi:hypothetical protein